MAITVDNFPLHTLSPAIRELVLAEFDFDQVSRADKVNLVEFSAVLGVEHLDLVVKAFKRLTYRGTVCLLEMGPIRHSVSFRALLEPQESKALTRAVSAIVAPLPESATPRRLALVA